MVAGRSEAESARHPVRHPSMAALVLVTGVGPLATDMYVAALPQLRTSLATTATVAQLTLTAFIVGSALGQLALGPLSDSLGRRRLLLTGAAAFAATALACALARSGWGLVAARVVQGLAGGGGVAIGRAVVGDAYHAGEAAKRYGTLAAITFLGPVVAPAVGGAILAVGTWRTVFAVLTGIGLLMVAAVLFGLPESLPPSARRAHGLRDAAGGMGDLARDWAFMRHVLVQCLTTAGFFTYIGGSSFVLQTVYGIPPTRYAAIFATNAAMMAVTSLLFRLTVVRLGAVRLRAAGVTLATAASVGLLAVAVAGRAELPSVALPWVLLSCVTAGMGLVIPATITLAQEAGRRARGAASALQGGLSFLVGAAVTPLTGLLGYHSLRPMAVLMATFFLLAAGLLALTRASLPVPAPLATDGPATHG